MTSRTRSRRRSRPRLTPAEAKRVAHAPTSNMAAYQLYLRALDLNPTLRTENLSGGELLGQAIRLDSGFAAAYAQLARNQMFRSVAGERAYTDSAFIAARKAIALDPELADGWFALGDSGERRPQAVRCPAFVPQGPGAQPEPRRRHGRPGQCVRRARTLR